jgi:hypothetical protein
VARRSVAALTAAILTYIGAVLMVLMGLSLVATSGGLFMGQPTPVVKIAGAPIPIAVAPVVGAVFVVVGLALIGLAIAAQRGHPVGRVGLTVIGGVTIVGLVYTILTADAVSPLPPIAWILIALALWWVASSRSGDRAGRGPDQRRR